MNFREYRKKKLKDPKFRKAMKDLEFDLGFQTSEIIMEARLRNELTQEKLAKKVGTKQPAIARAEMHYPVSLKLLEKVVKACGGKGILITPIWK